MVDLASIKDKTKKRVGRGISAGQGKTAGRGTKGQKSRAGHNIPRRFEGGQTPLSMRLPKLPGFKARGKKADIITLDEISKAFKADEEVTLESLRKKGLIGSNAKFKILANGTLTTPVKIGEDVPVSGSVKKISEKTAVSNQEETPKKQPVKSSGKAK